MLVIAGIHAVENAGITSKCEVNRDRVAGALVWSQADLR